MKKYTIRYNIRQKGIIEVKFDNSITSIAKKTGIDRGWLSKILRGKAVASKSVVDKLVSIDIQDEK